LAAVFSFTRARNAKTIPALDAEIIP